MHHLAECNFAKYMYITHIRFLNISLEYTCSCVLVYPCKNVQKFGECIKGLQSCCFLSGNLENIHVAGILIAFIED